MMKLMKRFLPALALLLATPNAMACMYDPAMFKSYDTNGDGFATAEEVIPILTKTAATREAANKRMAEIFARRGKQYNAAPFPTPEQEWVERWLPKDTDKDGKVSAAENEAAHNTRGGDTLKCL